jgi:hypothetical protein
MSNDMLMAVVFWGGCAWGALVIFECAFKAWLWLRKGERK